MHTIHFPILPIIWEDLIRKEEEEEVYKNHFLEISLTWRRKENVLKQWSMRLCSHVAVCVQQTITQSFDVRSFRRLVVVVVVV